MKKLALTACILCISAPFALAQKIQSHPKPHGHAPEMSEIAMALAGVTSVGGYLIIRRRLSRKD